MNGARKGLAVVTPIVLLAGLATGRPSSQETRPIDRWLISEPLGAEAQTGPLLTTDLLSAPGEPGVLPDRGVRAAGVRWSLLRRDGEISIPLDSVLPEAGPGTVVYAHAYIRLAADRTLRLTWSGEDCTGARAWLNGREVAGRQVRARLGAGWNTLLLKLVADDCPFGFGASLATLDQAGRAELDGVRVQASRPPGDVRTGPEDWVSSADTASIDDDRRWMDDRLYAGLVVGLTGWGRAPIADVEVELRSGADGRTTLPWLAPGAADEAVIPVRLDRLSDLLESGAVDVRLRWGEQQQDRRLRVVGTPPGATERVALEGWKVVPPGRRSGRGGGLPNAAGWALEGEWKVPDALAGRTLVLLTAGAPADYGLNGSPAAASSNSVTLCSPCSRGVRLRVRATSTGAWTGFPAVRVSGSEPTG